MMHRWRRALSMLMALVMAAGLLGAASPEAFAAGESAAYAEEQGLAFVTDTAFQIPVFYYLTEDGKYLPNTERYLIEPIRDANYTITELSLSEPDGEGMVELTLSYTIDVSAYVMNDEWAYSFRAHNASFSFFDYYSGYTFTEYDVFGNSSKNTTETVLSYNGEEIKVTAEASCDWKLENSPWSMSKYDLWQREVTAKCACIVSARFPAEYDGMCLVISKNGITEYSEAWENGENEVHESEPLHDWMDEGETKDDYYFLRVSELLAQQK